MLDIDNHMTATEVTRLFNIHPVTLWRWVKCHGFPAPVMVAGARFWNKVEILDYLQAMKVAREQRAKASLGPGFDRELVKQVVEGQQYGTGLAEAMAEIRRNGK